MPQGAWSDKRERQYEHIKESEKKQGRSTKRSKEIAAATVNKQRAEGRRDEEERLVSVDREPAGTLAT
jgi:hypothetical protein